MTLSGAIGGAGGLTKQGSGTLTLSALNSYADNTIIDAGTLIVAHDGALGAANSGTFVELGATLALSGGFTYATAEALSLNGAGVGGVGALENLSGNNTFAGSINMPAPGWIVCTAGTLTLSGSINTGSGLNGGLTVAGPGNTTISGRILGTAVAGLTVAPGPGTLTLTANNTYTGPTTVFGTLIVNGSQPASTITVSPGGTLGGTGSVGPIVVKGGTVEPGPQSGSTGGKLTAASADFSQGGTLLIRLPAKGTAGVDYDQLAVTGALTLGGTSNLQLDLNLLTSKANFPGIVLYGSVSGKFTNVLPPINNPLGLKVKKLAYGGKGLEVDLS